MISGGGCSTSATPWALVVLARVLQEMVSRFASALAVAAALAGSGPGLAGCL